MSYNNHNYAYIVGGIRALETRLMTPSLVERMVDAPSAKDAFRVLNDITYLSGSIGEYGIEDFQKILTLGLKKMAKLLTRMAPYQEVLNLLWLKYDFHNLKVILKARLNKHGYEDVGHAIIDLGIKNKSEWEEFLLTGEINELTSGMINTINDATQVFENNQNPIDVDLIVDKHFMEETVKISKKLNSDFLVSSFARIIDFTNLKTVIRCKTIGKDVAFMENILIKGGNVGTSIFINFYDKGLEALRQALERKMNGEGLLDVLDVYLKDQNLLIVEKRINELMGNLMDEAKKIAFGPEPVFAFFWRFERHLQIIRIILVGKLNGLSAKEIYNNLLPL